MSEGIKLIASERRRQIEDLGYSVIHDQDENSECQLSIAAACYAVNKILLNPGHRITVVDLYGADAFPWYEKYDKREKHDRLRSLVIAGALIAAEIDRVLEGERC